MKYALSINDKFFKSIHEHLFPGDGKEAMVVALCGRHKTDERTRLFVHKTLPIPHEACTERTPASIKWPTELIFELLNEAAQNNLSVILMHSHPRGCHFFSSIDDASDKSFCDTFYSWINDEGPHGSLVFTPEGSILGRVWLNDGSFVYMERIVIIGDDIKFHYEKEEYEIKGFEQRTAQSFGSGTTQLLNKLKVGVVGVSGTGVPVIEMLFRLGIGEMVLVDMDTVEEKNLNRLINTTKEHARKERFKVDVIREAIENAELGTKVKTFNKNLYDDPAIISEIADCDVIFGCVDSIDGRHLMNQISTFYLIPYFDVGVLLNSDGNGGIDLIMYMVQYLKPGGASLLTRNFYNNEDLRAAMIYRTSPEEYKKLHKIGYIADIEEEAPAVISINMQAASHLINDFLARIHPYKYEPNRKYAVTTVNITGAYTIYDEEGEPDDYLEQFVGRGDMDPLLNMVF